MIKMLDGHCLARLDAFPGRRGAKPAQQKEIRLKTRHPGSKIDI
jgi:hypothetical protein